MNKASCFGFRQLLLVVAAALSVSPALLNAQSPMDLATVKQVAPATIEIASAELPSAPGIPEPTSWSSSHAEPYISGAAPMVSFIAPAREGVSHRFWDRENRVLFTLTAGAAAADFCVTRANLANGGKELNPVTRILSGSTPGLAANFALETAAVVGTSYMFHKMGHHKLERMTSVVNIGASFGAVGYGLSHR